MGEPSSTNGNEDNLAAPASNGNDHQQLDETEEDDTEQTIETNENEV